MRFKSILAAIVITAGALATHTAMAETNLKVPFSFTVAGQSMPAGLYSVSKDTLRNVVILKSMDASKTFSAVLVPGDPAPDDTHVALKFEQSGNGHTLNAATATGGVVSAEDQTTEAASTPACRTRGRRHRTR